MRKFLLGLAVFVLVSANAVVPKHNLVPAPINEEIEESPFCWACLIFLIPERIDFGTAVFNPNNGAQGCNGSGVCSISWIPAPGTGPFTEVRDYPSDGRMIVGANSQGEFVLSCKGCGDLQGAQFSMDGDYTIPNEIASALRIQPYTIRKGTYTIARQDGAAVVIFPKR